MRIPFLSHEAYTIVKKIWEPLSKLGVTVEVKALTGSSVCIFLRNVQLVILYQRKIEYVESGHFRHFRVLKG
jgi:hypothetical protein